MTPSRCSPLNNYPPSPGWLIAPQTSLGRQDNSCRRPLTGLAEVGIFWQVEEILGILCYPSLTWLKWKSRDRVQSSPLVQTWGGCRPFTLSWGSRTSCPGVCSPRLCWSPCGVWTYTHMRTPRYEQLLEGVMWQIVNYHECHREKNVYDRLKSVTKLMESMRRWEALPTSYFSNEGQSQCAAVNSKTLWSHKAARIQPPASCLLVSSTSEGLSYLPAHPTVILMGHQSLQPSGTRRKVNEYLPQEDKLEEKCVSPNDRWNLFVKMFRRWTTKSGACMGLLFFRI